MWEGFQKHVRWNRSDPGGSKGKMWPMTQARRSQHVPAKKFIS